ncbi:glycosyltransferase [Acidimicrobiaceae bacterium USS-CC1]|uniref:Glycosyltransferase n=1 Tax=Acidiferrimicrobium australe TaxID=2664430 RepID=A0ABW9QRR8_9ACTN|nr:glycosyltransferase [Acidiferrimicrobium australe]
MLVPVYNRAGMLAECLMSIRRQDTGLVVQVLVVDDGSTDASADVAARSGADVLRLPANSGLATARNTGLQAAEAPWVAFLDSDDWWSPDHLSTLWAARDGVALVATSALTVLAGRRRVVGSPFPWRIELRRPSDVLRPENVIAASAAMVRRDVALDAGAFALRPYCEDLDLWVRLLSRAHGRVLPRLTVGYRSHEGQMSHEQAMGTEFTRLVSDLRSSGLLTADSTRPFATIDAWDARPGSGTVGWLARQVRPGRIEPMQLTRLLASRAAQRQRWRLQPGAARRLQQPPAVAPAPAAPTSRRA